jgi:hypothetical protein
MYRRELTGCQVFVVRSVAEVQEVMTRERGVTALAVFEYVLPAPFHDVVSMLDCMKTAHRELRTFLMTTGRSQSEGHAPAKTYGHIVCARENLITNIKEFLVLTT